MTNDVDMDAPQISTLREEMTPEPNPARLKFRVKLLVSDKKEGSKAGSISSKHGRAESDDEDEDEDEDEDDEEDQLIDDDEEEVVGKRFPAAPKIASAAPTQSTAPPSRGTPVGKRGGRGGRGRGRGRGRAGAPVTGPGLTWFETAPIEATTSQDVRADVWDSSAAASGSIAQIPARKKSGAPKNTSRVVRKKASKVTKGTLSLLRDDAESVSEACAGTAASSPMPHEPSPDLDVPVPAPLMHSVDDAPLEGVALPVYPLPSKPFPVQPPPKIGTGFAPVIPLDKGGKSVRKWRQVNREVRGVAGGRWFVKSWIGEKDSEFASAIAASQAAAQSAADGMSATGLSLPKLSAVSIPGSGRGRGRGARLGVDHASAVTSRAGSVLPESISAHAQLGKKRGSGPSTPSVDIPAVIPISAPAVT